MKLSVVPVLLFSTIALAPHVSGAPAEPGRPVATAAATEEPVTTTATATVRATVLTTVTVIAPAAPITTATSITAPTPLDARAVTLDSANTASFPALQSGVRVQVQDEDRREERPEPRGRWARLATALVDLYAMKVAADE